MLHIAIHCLTLSSSGQSSVQESKGHRCTKNDRRGAAGEIEMGRGHFQALLLFSPPRPLSSNNTINLMIFKIFAPYM